MFAPRARDSDLSLRPLQQDDHLFRPTTTIGDRNNATHQNLTSSIEDFNSNLLLGSGLRPSTTPSTVHHNCLSVSLHARRKSQLQRLSTAAHGPDNLRFMLARLSPFGLEYVGGARMRGGQEARTAALESLSSCSFILLSLRGVEFWGVLRDATAECNPF
jgi:hypothetical protein